MKSRQRTCSHVGCTTPLAAHNKSGLCINHNKGQKTARARQLRHRREIVSYTAKEDPKEDGVTRVKKALKQLRATNRGLAKVEVFADKIEVVEKFEIVPPLAPGEKRGYLAGEPVRRLQTLCSVLNNRDAADRIIDSLVHSYLSRVEHGIDKLV